MLQVPNQPDFDSSFIFFSWITPPGKRWMHSDICSIPNPAVPAAKHALHPSCLLHIYIHRYKEQTTRRKVFLETFSSLRSPKYRYSTQAKKHWTEQAETSTKVSLCSFLVALGKSSGVTPQSIATLNYLCNSKGFAHTISSAYSSPFHSVFYAAFRENGFM